MTSSVSWVILLHMSRAFKTDENGNVIESTVGEASDIAVELALAISAAEEEGVPLSTWRARQLPKYDKIRKILQEDAKRVPRIHIIKKYGISSDTFYRWIKNPEKYLDKYRLPEKLNMDFEMDLVRKRGGEAHSAELIKESLKDLRLEDNEIVFIYLYMLHRNATEAMVRLKSGEFATDANRIAARYQAQQWMRKDNVRQGIQRILEWEIDSMSMSLKNDIIGQLYKQAFYDPAMFIHGNGSPRFNSLDDIPIEWRCCVESIKTNMHPKNPNVVTYEIKLANRGEARRELSKYIKLYEDSDTGMAKMGEGIARMAQMAEAAGRRAQMQSDKDVEDFS